MDSVLNKGWMDQLMQGKANVNEHETMRTIAGLVVGLIEIREAIQENTAVQKAIAERARVIEEQGVEMLKGFDEIREDLQSQKAVVTELMKDLGEQARVIDAQRKCLAVHTTVINDLAEKKQDRPDVLNGPDTARAGG